MDAIYGEPDWAQPNALRRVLAEDAPRWRIGHQRSPAAWAAARAATRRRQGAIRCGAELRLSVKRCVRDGAQSFEGAFLSTQKLSSAYSVRLAAWGGVTVLGAIDSLPLGLEERPEEPEGEGEGEGEAAGQGVSEGPRYYDYGPGRALARAPGSRGTIGVLRTVVRGPSHLLPRRRSREPLPAARTCRPGAATARRVRSWRHRRVLRSPDVLPGRGPYTCAATLSASAHVFIWSLS